MADSIQIPVQIITKEALEQIKKFSQNSSNQMKKINKSTEEINRKFASVQNTLTGVSRTAKLVGGAIFGIFAGRAILNAIDNLIDKANQFESSLIGVRSVAANFGITATDITKTVEDLAADGLVPVKDVANSLKNLLATGLNLEKSTQLFLTLKDAAAFGRQGFLDLGQAIEGATQGIKNGQSTLVDNAGITKNLSVLQKEYAASIGTTIGKLTEAQKLEAIYQGILKEGAIFSGDASRLQETYTGAIAKFNFALSRLQVTLGQFITRSPVVTKIVSTIADAFNNFTEVVNSNNDIVSENVKSTVILIVDSFSFLLKTVNKVIVGFNYLSRAIPLAIFRASEGILKGINAIIDKINIFIEKFTILKPIEKFEDSLRLVGAAAEEAGKDIEKTVGTTNLLDVAVENLDQISQSLRNLEPTKNLDDLNKQIKETGLGSEQANENIKELSEKSIEFIERIGSRFSKVTGDIQQSLGRIGQSIQTALDFSFGTGASKIKAELDQLEKDLDKALADKKISPETFEVKKNDLNKLRRELSKNTKLGVGTGILNAFARGSQGAKNIVKGLGSLAADAFVPGLGKAAGPLLDIFAQGPEATKQAFDEFAKTVPTVVENILLAIPAAIESIADNIDIIIQRLVDRSDEIILALVRAIPRVSAALAVALAVDVPIALAKSLPQTLINLARGFVQAIIDGFRDGLSRLGTIFNSLGRVIYIGFKDALSALGGIMLNAGKRIFDGLKNSIGNFFYDLGKSIWDGFRDSVTSIGNVFGGGAIGDILGGGLVGGILGGGVGSIAGSIGGVFGFAEGGLVPKGFPSDSFPARLTSGEFVIDRSTTADLQEFLSSQSNQNASNDTVVGLLGQLVSLLRTDQKINTTVEFNDDALANIILNLSRNNARLA